MTKLSITSMGGLRDPFILRVGLKLTETTFGFTPHNREAAIAQSIKTQSALCSGVKCIEEGCDRPSQKGKAHGWTCEAHTPRKREEKKR